MNIEDDPWESGICMRKGVGVQDNQIKKGVAWNWGKVGDAG